MDSIYYRVKMKCLSIVIYVIFILFIAQSSGSLPGESILDEDENQQLQSKRQIAGSSKSRQHEPDVPEFVPGVHVPFGLSPYKIKPKSKEEPTTTAEELLEPEIIEVPTTTEKKPDTTTTRRPPLVPIVEEPPERPEPPSLTFGQSEVGELMLITDDAFYSECGRSKSCFGFPEGCILTHKCWVAMALWGKKRVFGSTVEKNNEVIIALAATNPSSRAYVAMGFSKDQLMGDDFVVSCLHSPIGPYVAARSSYNDNNYRNVQKIHLPCNTTLRPIVGYAQANGVLTCVINLKMGNSSGSCTPNIFLHDNYIMLSFGVYNDRTGRNFGELEKHYAAVVSSSPKSLEELYKTPEILHVKEESYNFHVYVSILAHVFLLPSANIMAKYGQEAFSWKIGNFPFWILSHVIMTVLGVLLSIIGIAVVAREIGETRVSKIGKAHTFFGFLACGLYLISILTGIYLWIKRRNINYYIGQLNIVRWLHWITGNKSVLIGIFLFLFAPEMQRAFVPCIFKLLAGLLLFAHVGTTVFMSFHTYWLATILDSTIKLRISCIGPMVPFEPINEEAEKKFPKYEAWHGRKRAVYFYMLATALIAIGMFLLVTGPKKLCFI